MELVDHLSINQTGLQSHLLCLTWWLLVLQWRQADERTGKGFKKCHGSKSNVQSALLLCSCFKSELWAAPAGLLHSKVQPLSIGVRIRNTCKKGLQPNWCIIGKRLLFERQWQKGGAECGGVARQSTEIQTTSTPSVVPSLLVLWCKEHRFFQPCGSA